MGLIRHSAILCALVAVMLGYGSWKSCAPTRIIDTEDPGQPLILTPLIKGAKIKEALASAKVNGNIFLGVESYSGYLTVDEIYNSNLFFWFFPAQSKSRSAPVILWLHGGPGITSMLGLFADHGPFYVTSSIKLALRGHTWTTNYSVIYIDNAVGTGYSFSNPDGYCQNHTIIGEHLYTALLQFFLLFPELQKNEFYLMGESYAAKYVTVLSYIIHKRNAIRRPRINLQGLSIGSGLIDPIRQFKYAEYLYQIGLIDYPTKLVVGSVDESLDTFIRNEQWKEAFNVFDKFVMGINYQPTFYTNITGIESYSNYVKAQPGIEIENLKEFVQLRSTRKAIHVGNITFHYYNTDVVRNLSEYILQPVVLYFTELIHYYKVLVYMGQLDVVAPYQRAVDYLVNLNFSAADEYKTTKRKMWYVGKNLAGYVKHAGKLTEVLVRNAGHMVTSD